MTTKKPAKEKPPPPEVDPRFVPVVDAFTADPEVTAGTMMASFGLKVRGKISRWWRGAASS